MTTDPVPEPPSGLGPGTTRICVALLEAVLADDASGVLEPGETEVCERAAAAYGRSVARTTPETRRGLAVLARVLEWLPLLIVGRMSRMSRLPIAERVRYLDALEHHRVGLFPILLLAFKAPLAIIAFEDGALLASTGFDRADINARRRLPVAPVAGPDAERLEGAS